MQAGPTKSPREFNVKKTCDACHGTGQRSYFKGESRFLLSLDECSVCCGLGFVEEEEASQDEPAEASSGEDVSPEA